MALGKVNGVYRLSQDVELRYLASGTALAKLNLVNSSKYKTQSGEQKEETCFIDGTVFGKLGEVANQYLKKGSKVWIDAELKQDTWTTQEGQNRSKHTLKINGFEMLDSKSDNQSNNGQANQRPNNGSSQGYNQNPPIVNETNISNINVDDMEDSIPF